MGGAIDPALLANMTLRPPPLGMLPNFENPETLRREGEIGMVFCIVIGAVFISLRLYAKVCITKLYDWDDGKLLLTSNVNDDAQIC